MTKKEYCQSHESIAYYSGLDGLECKGIEYGINDFMYCVSGAWGGKRRYHRVMIQYTRAGDPFITVRGYRCKLSDFVRMGV